MTNEVSMQEYQLRALENQYIDDLRIKNRIIADLRTQLQLAKQELANHTHGDDGEVQLADVEDGEPALQDDPNVVPVG